MITNFELKDSIAVNFNGRYIDLHNNFDFICYKYNILTRQIILKWTRSKGVWVPENEFTGLQFIHGDVSFLKISYDNLPYEFPNDDKCLSFISFFPSDERLINDCFIEQDKPKETDDIIYSFETEHFIRVGCKTVEPIRQ